MELYQSFIIFITEDGTTSEYVQWPSVPRVGEYINLVGIKPMNDYFIITKIEYSPVVVTIDKMKSGYCWIRVYIKVIDST